MGVIERLLVGIALVSGLLVAAGALHERNATRGAAPAPDAPVLVPQAFSASAPPPAAPQDDDHKDGDDHGKETKTKEKEGKKKGHGKGRGG